MKKEDLVVVYLSALVAASQFFWMKAEKRASYLEGRASVYAEFATDGTEGTCYAAGGCETKKHKGGQR